MSRVAWRQNCRRCLFCDDEIMRRGLIPGGCPLDHLGRPIHPKRVKRSMPVNWRCSNFRPRQPEAAV